MATPAITVPYGRSSYWDRLDQQAAQGKTYSPKQLMDLAYGERFAELDSTVNRQKINRDLALSEYRATNEVALKNRELDMMRDTNDKAWYGQLIGLGTSALMNYDKLAKGGAALWDIGSKAYDYFTGPSETYFDPTGFGYNIDQYMDLADLGYDPAMIDAYYGANELATWGMDAGSYSVPWYSLAKYGTYGLNELAKSTDFQPLMNFTEPAWGAFEGFGEGLSESLSSVWDNTFGSWF